MKKIFPKFIVFSLLIGTVFIWKSDTAAADEHIDIEIWYGDEQTINGRCLTQQFANVLGRVRGDREITQLTYRLNDNESREIEIGPNLFRLAGAGDFNIDIPIERLNLGANQVEIIAADASGQTASRQMTIRLVDGPLQSPPAAATFSWSRSDLETGRAVVIDGYWETTPDGIRSREPGYDRLVALCPMTWQNFEITVPVTVHSIDPRKEWPSNGSGVGLAFHWNGHEDWNDIQPDYGWYPIGGFNYLNWDYSGGRADPLEAIVLKGDEFWPLDGRETGLQIGKTYRFKLRSEHIPGYGSLYRSKVWLDDESEPAGWLLHGQQYHWHPYFGSILLVSHHADVTFGPAEVKNLNSAMMNRILNLLPFLAYLPLVALGGIALFYAANRRNRLPDEWRKSLTWAGLSIVLFAVGKPAADFYLPRLMHTANFTFEYISAALAGAGLVLTGFMFLGITFFILKVSRGLQK